MSTHLSVASAHCETPKDAMTPSSEPRTCSGLGLRLGLGLGLGLGLRLRLGLGLGLGLAFLGAAAQQPAHKGARLVRDKGWGWGWGRGCTWGWV